VARATPQSLTWNERALLAETQVDHLRTLDEEALLELLGRVRRARDRLVHQHRREVAGQVAETRARGTVSAARRRSASKAELFEAALARVSSAVARAARASAASLRAERVAAARSSAGSAGTEAPSGRAPARKKAPAPRARGKAPIERKATAASRASNARRQAERHAR
jgi:hypothetical protein